ncbi:MAG: energy-coupling factor ABC transporter permease [Myxococcota bacterium]|nr:energy-coupling factor ABC transporter permease [Myxococcota bacterium]
MHIPDGFLSAPVSLVCAALSTAGVAAACVRARVAAGPRRVALTGVTAAFVFAAQLLNFPVAGGTSGHLVGGVLAAVLLGPSTAVVVMTAVLVLQCLVFGDGGLLALGANVLNMAIVHPLVGFALYRVIAGRAGPRGVRGIASAAFGSWAATLVAAATCAGEIALSRIAAPALVLPAMLAVHMALGLGEAVITGLVLAALARLRPELLRSATVMPSLSAKQGASSAVLGLAVASALAFFVSPFACKWPDGIERVVERLGIEPSQSRMTLPAPFGGYVIPGLGGSFLAMSIAASVGTLLAFGVCLAIGRGLVPRTASRGDAPVTPSRP